MMPALRGYSFEGTHSRARCVLDRPADTIEEGRVLMPDTAPLERLEHELEDEDWEEDYEELPGTDEEELDLEELEEEDDEEEDF